MVDDPDAAILPGLSDPDEYVKLYGEDDLWRPAIEVICRRHKITIDRLERAELGTHIVFKTGNRVVKLFSPFWKEQYAVEVACLKNLTDLPVPQIDQVGEIEGWPYMIVSVVEGLPTRAVWNQLTANQKASVMVELGEFMRRLHDHPSIASLPSDWTRFLDERIRNLSEHHGLSGDWKRWALNHVKPLSTRSQRTVVLNCDLTSDHVFLVKRDEQWRLSAIIDFGDAMMGPPYYEFIAPLLDHAFGDSALAAALMDGYGELLTEEVKTELTRYLLIHLYWRLDELPGNLLERPPEDLVATVWGNVDRRRIG